MKKLIHSIGSGIWDLGSGIWDLGSGIQIAVLGENFTGGFLRKNSTFDEFAGFYRWDAQKTSGSDPLVFFWDQLVFCNQAGLKRIQPTENQPAGIDAGGSACFFFVTEHPPKKSRRVGGKQAEPGVRSFLIGTGGSYEKAEKNFPH